jgi:predicted SAM-dependent methyltransferase
LPLQIDVGAGKEPKPGYVPVDWWYEAPGYVRAQAWKLPYKTGEVDEVWCSHTLEHVEKRKVMPVLNEFHRVLVPGGKLTVEVPDLAYVCQRWLANPTDGFELDMIFGNQDPPGGQFHQTGFSPGILRKDLELAGFEVGFIGSFWSHDQECIRADARK